MLVFGGVSIIQLICVVLSKWEWARFFRVRFATCKMVLQKTVKSSGIVRSTEMLGIARWVGFLP